MFIMNLFTGQGDKLWLLLYTVFTHITEVDMAEDKNFKYPVPGPVETKKISENIFGIYGGSGANSYGIIGKTGVAVIDAKMTEESGRAVVAEIKKLTLLPITRIIITHSDLDHVNGLTGFPAGMHISSSQRTSAEMRAQFEASGLHELTNYLPNDTFSSEKEIHLDSIKMMLYHHSAGHTGGDTIIFLPVQRTAFVGDLIFMGRPPLIHIPKGGSSLGLINNLKFLLSLECDVYLSGHASPVGKKEIESLISIVETKRNRVIELKKQGKNLEEIKKEMKVVEIEMPPGRPKFPTIEEVIFTENI
jgi:glyoxylase-like metal-dependent hydrolase (beta-lactamase superfamily II)